MDKDNVTQWYVGCGGRVDRDNVTQWYVGCGGVVC